MKNVILLMGAKRGIVEVMCPGQRELIPPQAAFAGVRAGIPWQSSPAAASSAGDAESLAKITSVMGFSCKVIWETLVMKF